MKRVWWPVLKSEDIAKLAGVSRSTVSRVINNYPNVPEETRQKVMAIVNQYNYRPNNFARVLAGKTSNTIGLFFIIKGESEMRNLFRNDYYAYYLNLLVDMANDRDYYLLVNTVHCPADYEKVNRAFTEKRIDGAIIIGTLDETLVNIHMNSIKAPMVIFDYDLEAYLGGGCEKKNIALVNSNDYAGIKDAIKFLADKGHQTIGFINGMMTTRSGRVRYRGYVDALAQNNITYDSNYVIEGAFDKDIAGREVKKAVEDGLLPSAYICANDYMALETMKILKEHGIEVPTDVAVIGFDDVHLAEQSNPTLTTIKPDFYAMSQKAIEWLDQVAKGGDITSVESYDFDVSLVIRNST